jgi:hypothetical protein
VYAKLYDPGSSDDGAFLYILFLESLKNYTTGLKSINHIGESQGE